MILILINTIVHRHLYEVDAYFLEDILKITNFKYDNTTKYLNSIPDHEMQIRKDMLNEDTKTCLNDLLSKMLLLNHPENEFSQFITMVQSNDIPVDFRQSETKMTALMIAAGRNYFEHVKTLLDMKSNPELTILQDNLEVNCFDIAMAQNNSVIAQLLKDHINYLTSIGKSEPNIYNQHLLEQYFNSRKSIGGKEFYPEDRTDLNLVLNLICEIHFNNDKNGAIMVFLTGYDDIMQLANLINTKLSVSSDYHIFFLHSNMHIKDHKEVFEPIGSNVRKIILATNIAETSITIPEVCYVLDSGKEKQKCYDHVFQCSMLRSQWISKAGKI